MAMEISSNYSSYASGYAGAADSRKKAAATQTGSIGESGLSQKAQALLENSGNLRGYGFHGGGLR